MGFSVALGGRGFAVVEQRSDQFKRLAGGNQRRSEAVPQVMEAKVVDAGVLRHLPPKLPNLDQVPGLAGRGGEDEGSKIL
jgi:hypothetical protein